MKEISITYGKSNIRAILNDTIAARDFEERLPIKVIAYDNGVDYSCAVARGVYDPTQRQRKWKKGDISIGEGLLKFIYEDGELFHNCDNIMIIGHILEEDLHLIKKMPQKMKLTINKKEMEKENEIQ